MALQKARSRPLILFVLFFLLAAMYPAATVLAGPATITITVDGRPLNLETPPLLQDGHLLVPVRPVSEALQARVTWNEENRAVVIITPQVTINMKVDSKEVFKNGEHLSLDVAVRVSHDRAMVPLRFLAEALGARVVWDAQNQTVTITTPQVPVPERVYSGAFPARVAFSANNNLWLLDGSRAGAGPVQVTKKGSVEILGWSPDGQWLAYLQRETPDLWAGKPYLWVVKAGGSGAFQVDPRPVLGQPAWSPQENTLVYSTQGPGGGYAPDMNLKLAAIEDGQAKVTALLPDKSELVQDFAWAPDGQSLAVALRRTAEQPLRIDRITLTGERSNLLTLGEAGTPEGQIYPSFATGLTWSPNGRYLAYYLHPNSGSLAADGVPLQVLDLEKSSQPLALGTSLQYKQWLAWSPDGNKLAFIQGGNREATYNKRLCIATLPAGQITFYDQPGRVDTQPLWLPAPHDGVLFCRGLERMDWGGQKQSGVLLSDHGIWLAASNGQARPLTSGTPDKADYYPSVSPDGQDLYFLRLNSAASGSLCHQPLAGGPAVELVRNMSGWAGYYGNYYPAWMSIYYLDKTSRATGKLVVSNVEGRHFELETTGGRLVLLPDKGAPDMVKELEKYAGQTVTVTGVITNELNIYMRAPIMRVQSVSPVGNGGETPAGITSFTIAQPDLVVKGQNLARVEIWAIPTGTGITEKDYELLGYAGKKSEDNGQQVWTFPIPRKTILATEIFAKGYDDRGKEVGKVSLPFIGVTRLNEALGTLDKP
ncbi:hypothetical protein MGLY_06370 [Neomoorella glycerini]|uniref:Copper amine oxidase-like N-terminal domain-containing protein n=1 Tax=Neomoorella glycerini TaxID=55779 RepID=A0A6I5ZNG6_9FIRM|nr:stalk domain-containing protein [Moorella glycerini]QGP91306.1 hypothetical protein MGLY_06370 [Moorella glycerini]